MGGWDKAGRSEHGGALKKVVEKKQVGVKRCGRIERRSRQEEDGWISRRGGQWGVGAGGWIAQILAGLG